MNVLTFKFPFFTLDFYSIMQKIEFVHGSIFLIGLGFSSLHPFLISFVEQRISMSNKLIAFMTFSSNTFTTIASLLIGNYLDSNAYKFISINLIITCFAFLFYIILYSLEFLRLRNMMSDTVYKKNIF